MYSNGGLISSHSERSEESNSVVTYWYLWILRFAQYDECIYLRVRLRTLSNNCVIMNEVKNPRVS